MASRLVTYAEWVKHGKYPAGSPGKDAGKPFNPSDPNLRSYYDGYVASWTGGSEAHRVSANNNHGLSFANDGGGDSGGSGGSGGGGGGGGFLSNFGL